VLYDERHEENPGVPTDGGLFEENEQLEREVRLEVQFRF